ncbi:protein TOPAZ1 [Cyprinodon tularosa]|uniref:protein TOPAZ1 n=1 Tax=Cyprinodon tularosa TaxID=77115 RepID=UPI0018E25D4D|nr:protein TOPAZ1 [Cyprinodon tularosa]
MCRFLHLPREGDEKMCVDTVARFSNHLASLQRAGAVFAGYYQSSPPGEYFSRPVYLSLLWALLKAGMVSSIFSVLRVSLVYNLVPGHDFLLALFSYVRDKALVGFIPELLQHTIKMVSSGLELNLDCIENVKNTPMFQQTAHQISHAASLGSKNLSACPPNPDFLNLVHGNVEIQLCAKQEDWRRMGEVYRSICQLSQHPIHVERITGQIAIALLAENKNKVALPFAAFVESVCKNEDKDDSVVRSFVGRIGVSLMLRYHKNHHWHKGCKVVQVLSSLKMDYVTLKSLFGNEDGASPCFLITVAAELFLMSGMAEAALNTFREHGWFLGSWARPSKPADLESRTNVQIQLGRKISIRDTLEVLCNLPGVKEPIDSIDISRYAPHFTSHLQMCLETERHTFLPVASDTVEFMLSKGLAVDPLLLQTTIEKLGRQNHWLRAREVFKHSLSVGYYPEVSAGPGLMELTVPCSLGEVELVLSLEMFVALNASVILLSDTVTPTLSITLKRTHNSEVDYISAGTRLLLASSLPQPKLDVHYTNVNVSQEQVFRLDVSSARRWLHRNHLWASELWTPRARCLDQN